MNKLIPNMLKRKREIPVIKITFPNSGIALKRALTANFKLSFLLIILKGLKALKALKARKKFRLLMSSLLLNFLMQMILQKINSLKKKQLQQNLIYFIHNLNKKDQLDIKDQEQNNLASI